jgi:LEA14-like dessication related protein
LNTFAQHVRRVRRGAVLLMSVLCIPALLSSCASVEPPKVTLNAVEIEGVSVEGVELTLHADVSNPNGFGANVGRLEYAIAVDGTEVAKGRMADEVFVPAGGSADVDVPFTLTWKGMGEGVDRYLDGGEHGWKISGSVRVSNGALSKTFPFSESGRFQSPDASNVEIDF